MSKKVTRLFEQFKPHRYEITLHPDSENMSFSGSVIITGRKNGRPSKRLTFHQKDLRIISAEVTAHGKKEASAIKIDRINKHPSRDEVRLHAENMLFPGEYTIKLDFTGDITRPMHGLYPCFYENEGKENIILATQFESHHAREVFPCIDEPEAKAVFSLNLSSPADQKVISNTPIKVENDLGKGKKATLFEDTPVMSTYLLAFVIGEMHYYERKTSDGIAVRTWASLAQPQASLMYATDEAVDILEYFTDYFQTPFPLKKCDQVALPDFESGAMENWGLITYREIALLTDPVNRSQSLEQYVSMVVAHELSHQWFGNLVTMKWWDDLWLNESFASLMEHIALDSLHPDWHQWEQYTAADVIACSSRDIFKDVQPVQVEVNHPDEISTLFDPAIVYAKGGRLLKMVREYVGEDIFKAGLKSYFDKYAYKNTSGSDLWAEIGVAGNLNLNSFMEPWLKQSGMPLLEVTHGTSSIKLTQRRFVLDKDGDDQLWPVPLLADKKLSLEVLDSPATEIAREKNDNVIINHNGSGHMVVKYTDEDTKQFIVESFKDRRLKPESRINIINDLHLLSRSGDSTLVDSLKIISAASSEPRDAVWQIMARSMGTALAMVEGDDTAEKMLKDFRRKLASPWHKELGWQDAKKDDTNTKSLRQTILSLMVNSDDEAAVKTAVDLYKKAKNAGDLPAEQRGMILRAAVREEAADIDKLIDEYSKTPNADVQLAVCSALTGTKSAETGDYILERALGDKGFVRPQDIFRWYGYMIANRHTRASAWKWLKVEWPRLEELFGDSKSFEYFVVYSSMPISTPDMQKQFVEFFKPKEEIVALRRNIKVAFSEIEARVQWRKREEPSIKKYLSDL